MKKSPVSLLPELHLPDPQGDRGRYGTLHEPATPATDSWSSTGGSALLHIPARLRFTGSAIGHGAHRAMAREESLGTLLGAFSRCVRAPGEQCLNA